MTETIPKALLEVAGEPFVAHQLRLLAREGVHRVVLCLGYLGEQVARFVGDGNRFGLEVRCCFDGAILRGTGGALKRALPLLGSHFFVLYGDSYLDIRLHPIWDYYQTCGQPALMSVFRNAGRWDTSNVVYDGSRVVIYDKRQKRPDMEFIDFGLAVLRPELLNRRGEDEIFDIAEVYAELSRSGQLAGWESTSRFYEIGTPQGLADTDTYLRNQAARVVLEPSK
jgi:NDP-sugar pyrophosphorylase family protein